jgi:uncharacterized protein YodC (DUF2158 family)
MKYKDILKVLIEDNNESIKLKVGDVVNLKSYYPDIWLEVLWVSSDMFTCCKYNKAGTERWKLLEFKKQINQVRTKEEIPENYKDGIYYMANGKFGYAANVKWPTPLTDKSKAHSNFPEKYPEKYPAKD